MFAYIELDETFVYSWKENMGRGNILKKCRDFKQERETVDVIFENSRGTCLLYKARPEFLKSRMFRSKSEHKF